MAAFTDVPTEGSSTLFVDKNETSIKTKIERLKQLGLTQGLAETMIISADNAIHRYWIVDNSGSMETQDGKRIVNGNLIPCSRWRELGSSLKWHAKVSEILGVSTEFRMLNQNDFLHSNSSQTVVVDGPGSAHNIDAVLISRPYNITPLCRALREVVSDICDRASELESTQKSVSLIIASDGEATDGHIEDVKEALAPLTNIPCDVVVRLCTDEAPIVDYWKKIDRELELNLEILDDIEHEGEEVHGFNPWIGYGEALHRVREFGNAPKVFGLLDERCLEKEEILTLIRHILGRDSLPSHLTQWNEEFEKAIDRLPLIFDASENKVVPWINVKDLDHTLGRDAS